MKESTHTHTHTPNFSAGHVIRHPPDPPQPPPAHTKVLYGVGAGGSVQSESLWSPCSFGRDHVLNDGFFVEVRGPVDQIEAAEQHREHDAGHAIDLAHAVERLLVLLGLGLHLGFVGVGGGSGGLRDGGQRRVFGDVGGVVCHSDGVGIVLLHDGRFLFLQGGGRRLGVRGLLVHAQPGYLLTPYLGKTFFFL